jgi:multiple sugar transport system substrate-binding protein
MGTSMRRSLSSRINRRQLLQASSAVGAGLLAPHAFSSEARARQDATPSDQSGTFRAMSWETEAEMRKWQRHINNFFDTNYPNMEVQIDFGIPWDDYWTKLQTTIAGGAQLDMCWMHDSRAKSYAALGMLMPLDDYIAASAPEGWPDAFYKSQVEAFQYNGVQYGIPYDWASGGFYVNLDVLGRGQVDVPTADWTFDQLLDAGMKIKESAPNPDEQWGFALPTESVTTGWIVRSFGGQQVTPDPLTSHFNQPETIAAYQYLYDAIWTHQVMPGPDALQNLGLANEVAFASGLVGIMYSLNDGAFVFSEVVGDQAKWTMAPTPKGTDGRYQFVGGSAFSIPATAAFPDIAYACEKFTATDPANAPITAQMGSMFVSRMDKWEAALPDPAQADPEVYKEVFYTLGSKDGVAPLYFPGYQQWDSTIYKKNMDQLWANATNDVAGVLQQVHDETVAFLATIQS